MKINFCICLILLLELSLGETLIQYGQRTERSPSNGNSDNLIPGKGFSITADWKQNTGENKEVVLKIRNNDVRRICYFRFRIKLQGGQEIKRKWNIEKHAEHDQYTAPIWLQLDPGEENTALHMILADGSLPEVSGVWHKYCNRIEDSSGHVRYEIADNELRDNKGFTIVADWKQDSEENKKVVLKIRNNDLRPICYFRFNITLEEGQNIEEKWNIEDHQNPHEYTAPTWLRLDPGKETTDLKLVLNSGPLPKVAGIWHDYCKDSEKSKPEATFFLPENNEIGDNKGFSMKAIQGRTWGEKKEVVLVIRNVDRKPICYFRFRMKLQEGQEIENKRKVENYEEPDEYTAPTWLRLNSGQVSTDLTLTLKNGPLPEVSEVRHEYCHPNEKNVSTTAYKVEDNEIGANRGFSVVAILKQNLGEKKIVILKIHNNDLRPICYFRFVVKFHEGQKVEDSWNIEKHQNTYEYTAPNLFKLNPGEENRDIGMILMNGSLPEVYGVWHKYCKESVDDKPTESTPKPTTSGSGFSIEAKRANSHGKRTKVVIKVRNNGTGRICNIKFRMRFQDGETYENLHKIEEKNGHDLYALPHDVKLASGSEYQDSWLYLTGSLPEVTPASFKSC